MKGPRDAHSSTATPPKTVPRTCTICTHADRPAIDQALISGEPYRHIANRFGTSTASKVVGLKYCL